MNDKYPLALPKESVLAGQYIIESVLGQGGFGITYRAKDHKTGRTVAIKEFFPDSLATRTKTTVIPFTGERGENYTYGKECFLQEAQTLGQFTGNDNIVRIHCYFEENGTAYFVMDFIEGTSLDEYIKQHGGKLSYEETAVILIPVMDTLATVHSKGIIHRDVTPDNIYITKDGTVKLLDFGAARYSLGDKSRSLDVILKHGFAPKEQYTRRGRQGAFTDVYSLGATFYFALTGVRPPDSIDRLDEDNLIVPSALGVKLSATEEQAILKAMSVQPADRFQTMGSFINALMAEKVQSAVNNNDIPDKSAASPAAVSDGSDRQYEVTGFHWEAETPGEATKKSSDTVSDKKTGIVVLKKRVLNKKLWIIIIAAAVIIGVLAVIPRVYINSQRMTFGSEEEMLRAVQGTYAFYDGPYKDAFLQIVIDGDMVQMLNVTLGSEHDFNVDEWDYKHGVIKIKKDIWELYINRDGNIQSGDYIFIKEGT